MPWIWAQVVAGPASGGQVASPGSGALLRLSLRRWFGSLTLSPTSIRPGDIPEGAWAVLAGLGLLLLVALGVQGPRRALGQLVDFPGHGALLGAALGRIRRSGRLLMVVVGVTVVAWTESQGLRYAGTGGSTDLIALLTDRRVGDVAWAQGALAGLTPLRDVIGLALTIPMLLGVAFVLFQYSTFRWSAVRPDPAIRLQATRWATIGWGSTALYAIYRFVSLLAGGVSERPLGGCLGFDVVAVPILMALADGAVVAWVLVELRHGGGRHAPGLAGAVRADGVWDSGGGTDDERLDVTGIVLAIPAAVAACVLTFPARYIATATTLVSDYLLAVPTPDPSVTSWLRWELGWGLIAWQAAGLAFAGWLGAAAWSRGGRYEAARGFGRILRADGGRVVAALVAAALAGGLLAALAYAVLLSLPSAPWVLNAADSYAHYATLPVGLVLLAALVELGGRSAAAPAAPPKAAAEDWSDLPAWTPGSRSAPLDTKRAGGL